MDWVPSFLNANHVYIAFAYGLSFFVLGFSILLAPKPQLPGLAASLRFFGIFGLSHGLAEWTHVFELTRRPLPQFVHTGLLLIAGFCLLEFAVRMLVALAPERPWLLRVTPIFLIGWGISVAAATLLVSPVDVLTNAEVWTRYLLFLPGSGLAAWAFFKLDSRIEAYPKSMRRDVRGAFGFFVLHFMSCGLIAPNVSYPPAIWLSSLAALDPTGMGVLVFRTTIAIGATGLFLSMLRTFESQRAKDLENAQQAALIAQQQARQVAEQKNQELDEEKARAESLYHSILENANDAVFIHDMTGRFLEVNRTACERLGFTRAELLSMGVKQLDTPEMAARFDDAVRRLVDTRSSIGETCHVSKDGDCIPVEISSRVIDHKGELAVLTVARDIRERRRIADEIKQRNQELDELYHDAEERAERIAVTNAIIRTVSAGRSIGEIFQSFAEQTRRLVPYSRMGIALIDPAAGTMTFQRRYLEDGVDEQSNVTYPIMGSPVEQILQTKQPWVCSDLHSERQFPKTAESLLELGLQSSIIMPIIWKTQILGTLNFHSRDPNAYAAKDTQILEPIANQLAIAIENTRLQNQIKDMAIQTERDRLGRELHDGLGQVLGYVQIKTGEMIDLLRIQQTDEAQVILRDLHQAAQIAYADVREAILGLRSTVTTGIGLESTLQEYLHRYQREWGIHCDLISDGVAESRIAPSAEIQLLRIIQEALTNVRRHARAKNAWVRFAHAPDRVLVTIEDDGCGFDVQKPRREHFGLQTMHERAESVSGFVEVKSTPGQGTRVQVNLPCSPIDGSRR